MSAPTSTSAPTPTLLNIRYLQESRVLETEFEGGQSFRLSAEFLRVHSPSAAVRGHGPGQEVLQVGKREVAIDAIEPVGHYAVRLRFSDGHDSGLYSFDELYRMGNGEDAMWKDYLARMTIAGASRGGTGQ